MRVVQLVALFAACTSAATINYNAPTIVSTSLGTIEGLNLHNSKVKAYLGVPFALSPPKRFGAPQDPRPWDDTLKAKKVKPSCLQQFGG